MYEKEYSIIEKKIENLNMDDSLSFVCEFLKKILKDTTGLDIIFTTMKIN